MTTWLLAHQGGWDEVALFVVPVVIALLLVRWAERRSRRRREAEDVDAPAGDAEDE